MISKSGDLVTLTPAGVGDRTGWYCQHCRRWVSDPGHADPDSPAYCPELAAADWLWWVELFAKVGVGLLVAAFMVGLFLTAKL